MAYNKAIEEYNKKLLSIGANVVTIRKGKEYRSPYVWLRNIEQILHHKAEDYCNGLIDINQFRRVEREQLKQIKKCFQAIPDGFFINSDPRGYALKIEPDKILPLHRDFGGYYLLAPEL